MPRMYRGMLLLTLVSLLVACADATKASGVPTPAKASDMTSLVSTPQPSSPSTVGQNTSYDPFPVPASCRVTPMTRETRRTFPAWWLDGHGIEAGTPIGILYAGENKIMWYVEKVAPFHLSGEHLDGPAPPVQLLQGGPATGGPSTVVFPVPGCWRIHADVGDQALDAIVYVYPESCLRDTTHATAPSSPVPCTPPGS